MYQFATPITPCYSPSITFFCCCAECGLKKLMTWCWGIECSVNSASLRSQNIVIIYLILESQWTFHLCDRHLSAPVSSFVSSCICKFSCITTHSCLWSYFSPPLWTSWQWGLSESLQLLLIDWLLASLVCKSLRQLQMTVKHLTASLDNFTTNGLPAKIQFINWQNSNVI